LVNSLTDLDIGPLNNGDVINLFNTSNINIRANLCVEPIGSVKFNLNGPTFKVESTAPYALNGDQPAGNYNKWNASVGAYTLTAIPYSGASATGTPGVSKTISFTVVNQQGPCTSNGQCNDNKVCTDDICQNGSCSHPAIAGCCVSAAECDDSDICTDDACVANACQHTPADSEPSYLHVVNVSKSWRKLKLGYSPTSLYSPKNNVKAGGNTMMCVTLRGTASTEWSKIQIRPQGSVSSPASLGSYGLGTSFKEICIPLSAFGAGVDFTKLTLIEIPYSLGAGAFEIDIQKIEFRGGTTPFLWFGDPKTDNIHDGQSGSTSTLFAELVEGTPCGATKMAQDELVSFTNENMFLSAYPNPFSDKLNIEFALTEASKATLEIYNVSGQKLATLFEGMAGASELVKVEFIADEVAGGMIIYRLQTEQGTWFNKAILVR